MLSLTPKRLMFPKQLELLGEMEELLGMSDRILVLHEGHAAGELSKEEFSQDRVLELASGM